MEREEMDYEMWQRGNPVADLSGGGYVCPHMRPGDAHPYAFTFGKADPGILRAALSTGDDLRGAIEAAAYPDGSRTIGNTDFEVWGIRHGHPDPALYDGPCVTDRFASATLENEVFASAVERQWSACAEAETLRYRSAPSYAMDRPVVVLADHGYVRASGLGAMEQLRQQLAVRDDVVFVTRAVDMPGGTSAVCAAFKVPACRADGHAGLALFDFELPERVANIPMGRAGGAVEGDAVVAGPHDPSRFRGHVSEVAEDLCAGTRLSMSGAVPGGFAESYPVPDIVDVRDLRERPDGTDCLESRRRVYYRGERLEGSVDMCRGHVAAASVGIAGGVGAGTAALSPALDAATGAQPRPEFLLNDANRDACGLVDGRGGRLLGHGLGMTAEAVTGARVAAPSRPSAVKPRPVARPHGERR